MAKKRIVCFIEGKPSSLTGIRRVLKKEQARRTEAEEILAILRGNVTAEEAHKLGISQTTLRTWRNDGKLRAIRVKSIWYYSRQDLLEIIKTKSDRPQI